MAVFFVVEIFFDHVTVGVTEIQQHSLARVKLVVFHDNALNIHAPCNDFFKICAQIFFGAKGVKKRAVVDCAVLYNLRHTAVEHAFGQGFEHKRVDNDKVGRIETAGKIFALGKVDCNLSAHRAVNLCEQSCGDLNKAHTAQKRCRGKTR